MTLPQEIEQKLLPCPFCGGKATRQVNVIHPNGAKTYETGCDNKGCLVHPSSYSISKKQADEFWNTRQERSGLDSKDVNVELLHALEYLAYERNPIGEKYIDTCSETCQMKVIGAIRDAKTYPLAPQGLKPLSEKEVMLVISKNLELMNKDVFNNPHYTKDIRIQSGRLTEAICSKFAVPNEGLNKEVLMLLRQWLDFSKDVQPNDAAGCDWLEELKNRTRTLLSALENKR